MIWVLMLVAAIAHLLPEHLAALGFGSQSAWEYVGYGAEAAALWVALGARVDWFPVKALAAWGAMEGVMRVIGRLSFPMSRPPPVRGQALLDAATGWPTSSLSLVAAAVVCMLAARRA